MASFNTSTPNFSSRNSGFDGIAGTPAAPPTPEDLIAQVLDEERFKSRRDEELSGIEEKRDRDIASGQDFIKDFTLGRITETPLAAENQQIRDLLQSRLAGLNAGEGAALREQAFRGLNQQRQGDIRDLRGIQGAQGVRGPAAVAQQQNVFSQAANRGSDLEQQLLLRNIDIQDRAASNFQGEISRQQGQQLGINQFNIGQGDQEAGIKAAFPFLFANLGAQEQATATNAITGRDALIASLFPQMFGTPPAQAPAPWPVTPEPDNIGRGKSNEEIIAQGVLTGQSPETPKAASTKGKPISMDTLREQFATGGFRAKAPKVTTPRV